MAYFKVYECRLGAVHVAISQSQELHVETRVCNLGGGKGRWAGGKLVGLWEVGFCLG